MARSEKGAPLPEIPELATLHHGKFRVVFRRGQMTIIGGRSGAWKSGLMLFMAKKWNLPTIYVSADMEEDTALTREAAFVTHESTETIAHNIKHGGEAYYAERVDDSNIHWSFDPNPTLASIEMEIAAFVEMYDEYPAVIVIDNLMDCVWEGGENEYAGMKELLLEFKRLARETGAAVFVLHHMSESEDRKTAERNEPAPRSQILGKVSQTANRMLSVALDGTEYMIAVVKQRNAPDDKHAKEFLRFRADPGRNLLFPWTARYDRDDSEDTDGEG